MSGTHIDRAMYKDLQAALKADEPREQLIEVIEKNFQDGPMASRDMFVVGEHNALARFIAKDLPAANVPEHVTETMKEILEFVPVYDVAAIRSGAQVAETDPMKSAFYIGTWELMLSPDEDPPSDDRLVLSKITVDDDGSWKATGPGGREISGKGYTIHASEWGEEPGVKRAVLELLDDNARPVKQIMAAYSRGMAILMTVIDPVGGEHQMLRRK